MPVGIDPDFDSACGSIIAVSATDHTSRAGQARRLMTRTRRVLIDEYGLEPSHLRARPPTFNQMVRAVLADGSRVAVRIGSEHRIHPMGVEDIERHWLEHLVGHRYLVAPRVVPDGRGRASVPLEGEGAEPNRVITVFTWVPGRRLRRPVGPGQARQLGELAAQLHLDAATLAVEPRWQQRFRAEGPITFGPRNGLNRWSGGDRALLIDAQARCRAVIDELWRRPPHPPHLLHGDLGPHNVLTSGDALNPVDFQDLLWGFDVQDLGISLSDLRRAGSSPAAVDSFRLGYDAVRPWPLTDAGLADAFDAGRSLNLINLALTVARPDHGNYLARHVSVVRAWMAT
ncbi:MAG: phosphotransferase enzyme family protein [Acidimicrobiales bacterium]